FVGGAQTIQHPGTERRSNGLDVAVVHLDERGLMVGHVALDRANDATMVDDSRDVRQRFAYFQSALSISLEGKWRRHEALAGGRFNQFAFGMLAFEFLESGLWIERVALRGATIQEK